FEAEFGSSYCRDFAAQALHEIIHSPLEVVLNVPSVSALEQSSEPVQQLPKQSGPCLDLFRKEQESKEKEHHGSGAWKGILEDSKESVHAPSAFGYVVHQSFHACWTVTGHSNSSAVGKNCV